MTAVEASLEQSIQVAAGRIRASRALVILTGAGVSRESGVPTFRDSLEGLWAQYDPALLATPQAFARDPKLVWDFYQFRREMMRPAQPNPGHHAIADLERRLAEVTVITQNVDELHEAAGSRMVLRLHGRIFVDKCAAHCHGDPTVLKTLDAPDERSVPRCPHCGALARPDVVWFNERLSPNIMNAATRACENADVMLVVGTSGIVTPAAYLPGVGKNAGAYVIEVNPMASEITATADLRLSGASGEILPRLVKALADA